MLLGITFWCVLSRKSDEERAERRSRRAILPLIHAEKKMAVEIALSGRWREERGNLAAGKKDGGR